MRIMVPNENKYVNDEVEDDDDDDDGVVLCFSFECYDEGPLSQAKSMAVDWFVSGGGWLLDQSRVGSEKRAALK